MDPAVLTPALCRAGRGLLDWTQDDLATNAGLSRSTVRDFEKGRHLLHIASAQRILDAFALAGVALLSPEAGPGLRLMPPPMRRA